MSGTDDLAKTVEAKELTRFINTFLSELSETDRSIFLCSYWYLDPPESIAKQFSFSQSNVNSTYDADDLCRIIVIYMNRSALD